VTGTGPVAAPSTAQCRTGIAGGLRHVPIGANQNVVMAGLVPAIHALFAQERRGCAGRKRVHARLTTRYARA
jgi:hypothetical protein